MRNPTPVWIAPGMILTGVGGLVFLISPTLAVLLLLAMSAAAGLFLFAAVTLGKFDPTRSDDSYAHSSDSSNSPASDSHSAGQGTLNPKG